MINNSYVNLSEAERLAKKFKVLCIVILSIFSGFCIIGGIIVCAVVEISTGISLLVSGIVSGALGIFGIHVLFWFVQVACEAMCDVKESRIMVGEIKDHLLKPTKEKNSTPKAFETCSWYYLMYIERGAYLFEESASAQTVKTINSLIGAMKFQSEEEALKYADYKGLKIGEKWKVVKKDLIVPIE